MICKIYLINVRAHQVGIKINNTINMKNINEYISEALSDFSTEIKNLKYQEEKPTSNQDDYIQIITQGKSWKDEGPILYIKTSDLKYIDEMDVLSVIYNLMKDIYPKGVTAEIGAWDDNENDYVTFAISCLQKKNRMWHPEYIKNDNYEFN